MKFSSIFKTITNINAQLNVSHYASGEKLGPKLHFPFGIRQKRPRKVSRFLRLENCHRFNLMWVIVVLNGTTGPLFCLAGVLRSNPAECSLVWQVLHHLRKSLNLNLTLLISAGNGN